MRTNLINKIPKTEAEVKGVHDMVIAFDTTGSMSRYIGAVKKHVRELVPKLLKANPNMRISVVAFGDYCDMKSATDFGDAYQCLPLTDNKKKIINFISNAKNTGGGDGDEFYELVIKKIVEETDWRQDSVKSVLFIADAAPHRVGYSYGNIVQNAQIDWRQEAIKAAELGISFDTLSIHGEAYNWYEELSQITDGIYAPFSSSHKTSQLVEAAAYSRGGDMTKAVFMDSMLKAEASGDTEMLKTYAAYSKKVTL